MSGFGEVPSDMITASQLISNSDPLIGIGLLRPEASGSPSSIRMHFIPQTCWIVIRQISVGFVSRWNTMPSSLRDVPLLFLQAVLLPNGGKLRCTSAPSLKAVLAASIATFPPPTTTTFLPL